MQRLLNLQQDKILRSERALLEILQVTLARLDAPQTDLELIQRSLHQLEELFLLVIVGEFNAGKSAVINALLGDRYLEEGVIPTTSQLYLIRHGDERQDGPGPDELRTLSLPVDWLQEVNLVDTGLVQIFLLFCPL